MNLSYMSRFKKENVLTVGILPTPLYTQLERNSSFLPVKIHHFGPVSFSVVDEVSNLTIAICLWYLPHRQFGRIGKPV